MNSPQCLKVKKSCSLQLLRKVSAFPIEGFNNSKILGQTYEAAIVHLKGRIICAVLYVARSPAITLNGSLVAGTFIHPVQFMKESPLLTRCRDRMTILYIITKAEGGGYSGHVPQY